MSILIKEASQIEGRNVRLILPTGNVIMDKTDAINKALAEELDLVLVQEGEIPVVKLVNYDKLEYDKQKNVKANKAPKAKQVRFGPHTQDYDLKRFAIQASGFISDGHPTTVKVEIKGRNKAFQQLIKEKIAAFVAMVPNAKPGKMSVNEEGSEYLQPLN
jgi:translation initiation factor IF-3